MKFIDSTKSQIKRRKSLLTYWGRLTRSFSMRRKAVYRRRVSPSIGKRFLLISLLIILITLVIYIGANLVSYVSTIREKYRETNIVSAKFVVGFDSIPEFPKSTFIFKDQLDNDNVKSFLSSGQSIYRLNPGVNFDEVVNYYKTVLPKNGWKQVLVVSLESEDRKYGSYWVKDDTGVRIYSKLNDIWYQTVSVEDARNGLESQVKKEVELKLLLSQNENQDFRPDFPWLLSFSNDYLAIYSATDLGEFQSVRIQRLGSNKYVDIIPLGYVGAYSYDRFIENEIKNMNEKKADNWGIVNTSITLIAGQEALHGEITDGSNSRNLYIVGNPRNNIAYIFIESHENDPFLKFIVDRIQPAKTSLN